MAQFFAATQRGLNEVLEQELASLDFKILRRFATGVLFETNWEGCYRANLCSRIASRVLKPVLNFSAYQKDELYGQIRKHDFTKYIKPNGTLMIDATVNESKLHDQRVVALTVKDAIVDQFREKFGERPDVDKEHADLKIFIRGMKNQFDVGVDTSGDALFMRGYRLSGGIAPLKENLAAGLIALSGWNREIPIVDPMCGSGTFLIEAALMAQNIAPGTLRQRFGFQKLTNYDKAAWEKVIDETLEKELPEVKFKFYGFDINRKAISEAKANAKRAGVDSLIEFRREPITTLEAPCEKGAVIVNPPYGVRIGGEDELKDVYRDLAYTFKRHFKGWDCWILAGNRNLIRELDLKASRKHFIFNGAIECRFLKYSIF